MTCTECGGERGDHLPRYPMAFFGVYADAMRTGEPGPCSHHADWDARAEGGRLFDYTPYHTLDGDAVRALREAGAGGGVTHCLDCGKAIFVPGLPDRGIVIRNMPGAINLKGVEL